MHKVYIITMVIRVCFPAGPQVPTGEFTGPPSFDMRELLIFGMFIKSRFENLRISFFHGPGDRRARTSGRLATNSAKFLGNM